MQNKTIGELLSSKSGRLAVAYIRQAVEQLSLSEHCAILNDIAQENNEAIKLGGITEKVYPILNELENIANGAGLPTKEGGE